MNGKLLEFKRPKLEPKPDLAERLVELAIALKNGEVSLEDLREEVNSWDG